MTAPHRWRPWCLAGAAPSSWLSGWSRLSPRAARRIEYVAALQFSLLAIVVPALVTVGAPWRLLRLAGNRARRHPVENRSTGSPTAGAATVSCPGRSPSSRADLGVVVAWHAPGAVAAVARHGWLVPLEAASLLVFGLGLWLELVASPPLAPRSGHLRRAVLAALAMWAFWILAYVIGLSNHDFYRNFHHAGGWPQRRRRPADRLRRALVRRRRGVRPGHLLERTHCGSRPRRTPTPSSWRSPRAERRRGMPPAGGRRRGHGPGYLTLSPRRARPIVEAGRRGGRWMPRLRSAASSCAMARAAIGGEPWLPPSTGLCSAEALAGVAHQRLHVLDRPQGVRGGPQRRGRHQLAQVLAGRRPGNLDVRPGRRCSRS